MPTDSTISTAEQNVPSPIKGALGFTYFLVAALVALWGLSFATFGVVGLYLPAVALVPVVMIVLLWITVGK